MAFQASEVWISSNGCVGAVKRKNGGWIYFTSAGLMVNGQALEDNPVVAREITKLNLELIEAKSNG